MNGKSAGKKQLCEEGQSRLYQKVVIAFRKSAYYRELTKKYEKLSPGNYRQEVRSYIRKTFGIIGILAMGGGALVLGLSFRESAQKEPVEKLNRADYWGGGREEELEVTQEDGTSFDYSIAVSEKEYDEKEVPQLLEREAEELKKHILGDNKSLDHVTKDLVLVSKIPKTEIEVMWETDNDRIIGSTGELNRDALVKEGTIVQLTAVLSYKKQTFVYSFAIEAFEEDLSTKEGLIKKLNREIQNREKTSVTNDALLLPNQLDGKSLSYHKKEGGNAAVFGFLLIVGLILFGFVQKEKLTKKVSERNLQLKQDYSELVSKITLLLGAGMTVRNIFEKLAQDYVRDRTQKKSARKYVYEEVVFAFREMQGGLSEQKGLKNFGRRCALPCYQKLSGILQQSTRKGAKGMSQILEDIVEEAFEERKNMARQAGETAGTKLLGSMLIMLVIVLVILILPACLSFRI